jgi:hypothetical protein
MPGQPPCRVAGSKCEPQQPPKTVGGRDADKIQPRYGRVESAAKDRRVPRPPPGQAVPGEIIAFYPQALETLRSGGPYGRLCYLDVPWEEPQLAAELKLRPAPQRRWLARIYHSMRPVKNPAGVEYEPLDVSQESVALDAEIAC